jgi:hypothetical protein
MFVGITGQDGSYLLAYFIMPETFHELTSGVSRTELLLEKGYEVHGIIRRSSSFNTGRLHHLYAVRPFPRSSLSPEFTLLLVIRISMSVWRLQLSVWLMANVILRPKQVPFALRRPQ